MTDTVFVTMYAPALGNVQVDAPLQAVSTYQAHGWLLLDPNATPPPIASPYLSQPAADSRYLRDWAGAEVVTAGAVRVAPDGHVIVRTADGTTRSTYDTTEQAAWSSVTAGVAAVAGLTGSPTAQQIVDALATPLRAAYGLAVAATVTASGALVPGKHNPVDATGGAKTMTLPTGAVEGASIGVEKLDSSANAVTVTGNVRGASGQSISLPWAHETLVLRADATGSWWPVSGHKTKTSLDAAYGTLTPIAKFGAVGTADDTATFTAAAAAGVAVYVPAGTYRLMGVPVGTGTRFVMAPGVVFKPPTSFVDGSAAITMFQLWDGNFSSTAFVTDCGLVGGPWTVDFTGYSSTANSTGGVKVYNAKRFTIENLTLLNAPFGAAVQLAKNGAGTMPEDGTITNIRWDGTTSHFGPVQLTSGRKLYLRQLVSNQFCALSMELDFGDHTNAVVEDVVADGLWLERPASAASTNQEAGVKFVVPSTCRISRVSVRNVRVLNADGIQMAYRDPYGAGTIEDVTVEDVLADCNSYGHFGITVYNIDPSRVVVRKLRVINALTNGGSLQGGVTLYDCISEGAGTDAWVDRDLGTGIVAGRVRRFYNCKAINSNNGSGWYTGSAARYELYGCEGTDSRGGSALQRQGFNVASGGASALLVGCSFVGNLNRRVFIGSGSSVREFNSPDPDTNGATQAAPPTTGIHAQGEVVWNSGVSATTNPGWVCTVAGEPGTWVSLNPLGLSAGSNPDSLASGEATIDDRAFGTSASASASSGQLRFTYFTAKKSESITQLRLTSGGTAASATPTLVRAGIYSVAANGDLTLITAITSDTAIYAAANTQYLRSLGATFSKVAGNRYAIGELVVSAATMPTRAGVTGQTAVLTETPRRTAALFSQTDLPSTATSASLSASNSVYYVELVP